ncbi:MAG TPA: PBECR2 nuclease fold domain-containing protein, partial [Polyangiaceae bacterium]|nr:PBECR2 nuclease fold domain-containing protein [Polyangiaceae bacterium]
ERYGLKVSKRAPAVQMVNFERRTSDGKKTMIQVPKGIDPSFDYNPGMVRRGWTPPDNAPVLKPVKKFSDYGLTAAKQVTGRPAPAERWPIADSKAAAEDIRGRFNELFGGTEGIVKDPTGDQVHFTQRYLDHLLLKKESGDAARASFVPLAKQTTEQPFEIWLLPHRDTNTGRVTMRKRYIGLFEDRDYVLIADRQPDGYMAWTSYPRSEIDSFRQGQLLYAGSDPAK